MPIEDDVEEFCIWATKLGCPPNALPNEEALKSIFKSRQRELFCMLMKRVLPRQDVQEIKENILINKMQGLSHEVVPACSRSFLPKELQTFMKVKDLKKRKDGVETGLAEYKREYDSLAANIKTKTLQSIDLEHKYEKLENKVNIYEFKSEMLDKDIKKEVQNKEQILANMPVKLTEKNANEYAARETVERAMKVLDEFYNLENNENSPHLLPEAKEELWQKMRKIFANIPNFLIFKALMRIKEEQLQNIITLNKTKLNTSLSHSFSNAAAKEPLSAFEIKLMETKADLLGIVACYLRARYEHEVVEERFGDTYEPFINELQKKVNLFNADTDENTDEIITDYVVQYNLHNFLKSKNEFLTQQIELYKAEIENGAKKLKDHEVLLSSIKQVYSDINTSLNHIQYGIMQLGQIKNKIIYSKNMIKHMLNDMQHATTTTATALKSKFLHPNMPNNVNMSTVSSVGSGGGGGGDSFELGVGGDNVFCSTKLDLDCTAASMNNTMLGRSFSTTDTTIMPAASAGAAGAEVRFTQSPHLTELNTFAEIPLEKFSCMPKQCAIYFTPNPLAIESRELLSSTIQLAPGILLTPFGALQEVRNRIAWADLIAAQSNDLKMELDLIAVDVHAFRQNNKQQRDFITELLDNTNITCVNTNRVLKKAKRFYDFILENPLGQFIPATKCFNNLTFSEYEAEYAMYYRMSTIGNSIKNF